MVPYLSTYMTSVSRDLIYEGSQKIWFMEAREASRIFPVDGTLVETRFCLPSLKHEKWERGLMTLEGGIMNRDTWQVKNFVSQVIKWQKGGGVFINSPHHYNNIKCFD